MVGEETKMKVGFCVLSGRGRLGAVIKFCSWYRGIIGI